MVERTGGSAKGGQEEGVIDTEIRQVCTQFTRQWEKQLKYIEKW